MPARLSLVVCGVVSLLLTACGSEESPAQAEPASAAAVTPGTASVFDDALGAGWQDWSWAAVNAANASPVVSGTRSLAVTFSASSGLFFHRTTAAITGMSTISLAVNGGATAGAHLQLVAVAGSTQLGRVDLGTYCASKSIPQNAWTSCQVPLAAVGAATTTPDGFWIQEGDGQARPVMYFDEIYLAPPASAPAVPAAPANLKATAASSAVSLSWSAVSGATGYDVWRATSSGGTYTRLTAASQAGTTYADAAVTAGATYWYRVTASNAAGAGAACPSVSATVPAGPAVPAAPTGVAATASAGSVRVSWSTSAGATGYGILRAAQSGGPYSPVVTTPVVGTTWTDTSVTAGATYWYEVMAAGTGGNSGVSAAASATVPATATIPAAPANLTAAAASSAVALSWSAASGATGYDVWRATSSGGTFTRLTAASQAGLTYADAAVTAGATYWYRATASNATGTSAACTAVSATVPATGAVTVALSPTSGTVDACGGRISFVTTVAGSTNTAVTWSIQEGAAGGTVDATGTYTAPATAGTYHVVATSAASSAATATATVTVSERMLSVTVSPADAVLAPGETRQFTATVTTSCGTTVGVQTVTAPL